MKTTAKTNSTSATTKTSKTSKATRNKVARDTKAEKAKAPRKTAADNPMYAKALTMILAGHSPAECKKELGCRRSYARRILKQELEKLGSAYSVNSRIKDGKAIVVTPTPRCKKAKADAPEAPAAPKRFEVREAGNALAIFDTVTGKMLEGCKSRKANKPDAEDNALIADRLAAMPVKKLKALLKTSEGAEAVIGKAVLAILEAPAEESVAQPEVAAA